MRIKLETTVGLFMILALTVFLFMSFKIGIWRIDTIRYAHYITYFSDVSGLNEKSDILIAGVKVGWVQKLSLVPRNKHVRIDMMIDRNSILYANAHGVIRQNGLLGSKYIEIISGDSSYPLLPPGSTLMEPNKPNVSIDEILVTFKEIADNVNSVTASIKEALGDKPGNKRLGNLISSAHNAFDSFDSVSRKIDKIIALNENSINNSIKDFSSLLSKLQKTLPDSINSIENAAKTFSTKLDSISKNINSVSTHATGALDKVGSAAKEISSAGKDFQATLKPLKDIAEDIEKGKGVLGALCKDEELSKEIKSTVKGVKDYVSYMDRLSVNLDMHLESMQGVGNDLDFKDAKGYFNFIIRPYDDFYYLAGLVSSYQGAVLTNRVDTMWSDQSGREIIPHDLTLPDWARLQYAPVKYQYTRDFNAIMFNLQFAKEFGRLSCRTGVFESSFGIGFDYELPLAEGMRWITSFELFRFNEFLSHTLDDRLKLDIDYPHLKWYNKVFFNDALYFVFGADDFVSKYNKNFFVGLGLTFEQNDMKYLSSAVKIK